LKFLQKILLQPNQKTMADQSTPVELPDTSTQKPSNEIQPPSHPLPGMHVGKQSDVGRERERNEDSFLVVESVLHHDLGTESFGLFIVADGMGGHKKGELASSLAVREAANSILQDVYLPYLTNNQNANNRPLNEALVLAVEKANSAVLQHVPNGGTTLLLALVLGNNAYLAHVGDSRAYIFKDGVLKQITRDHSLAKKLQEMGQSAEETRHAQSVLYRAIGQGEPVEVDTHLQHLPPGSSLLLCSDGLWGMVDDAKLREILEAASTPQHACNQLIDHANQNGGRDNITAVVVSIGPKPEST